jgi:PAS domain S-box-containing protein
LTDPYRPHALPGTLDGRPVLLRLGFAALAFALALWGRFALTGVLPPTGYPFLTFFPAVLVVAWCAGLGPGLLVSAASVAAAWYWFITPNATFALSLPDLIALATFAAILVIDCVVIHLLRRAMRRLAASRLALAAGEQRLRQVLDGLQVHAWLLDPAGRVVEVNRVPLQQAGLQRDDVLGRDWSDSAWWGGDAGTPGRAQALVARAAAGETVREDVRLGRDEAAVTLDLQLDPLRDADGRVVALVAGAVDVSERVRAVGALRESEERFRLVADNLPQLAWMAEPDGAITWYNQRWYDYTGTTFEQMQGWGWKSVHHPDHLEQVTAKFVAHVAAGEVWEDTFPMRAKDGSWRWFLSRALPLKDREGRVLRWFGTNTDVTEQRAIEQSLREADRQKDIFLATLAHELRNPLAPIRAAGQIVRLSTHGDERLARAAAIIERQSAQLARLVDDLLDLSRIRSGRMSLRLEDADLQEAIEGTVETWLPQLQAAGQQLVLSVPAEPLPVRLDVARAIQCIGNVLHNASKFSPAGSRIELQVARVERWVRITVRDPGQGMPAELLPRVFDLFVQESHSGMAGHTGLGIGLALTRHLVEMHGGAVRARSPGRGQGSEVEMDWPLGA